MSFYSSKWCFKPGGLPPSQLGTKSFLNSGCMQLYLETGNRTVKNDAFWDTLKLSGADSKISNHQLQLLQLRSLLMHTYVKKETTNLKYVHNSTRSIMKSLKAGERVESRMQVASVTICHLIHLLIHIFTSSAPNSCSFLCHHFVSHCAKPS